MTNLASQPSAPTGGRAAPRPCSPRGTHAASEPATQPRTQPRTPTKRHTRSLGELLPPYHVVLHNDDVNDMMHVVRALLASVPELDERQAVTVMMEAHHHGRAQVIACPLERAELYRDRLQSFSLTATIERV